MDPSAKTIQPPSQQPRRIAAKSVASLVPISAETCAIVKRQTGLELRHGLLCQVAAKNDSQCQREHLVGVPLVRATWPASNVAAPGLAFFFLVLLLLTRLQLVTLLCFLSTRVSVCVLVGGLVVLLFVEKLFTAGLKENYSLTFGSPSLLVIQHITTDNVLGTTGHTGSLVQKCAVAAPVREAEHRAGTRFDTACVQKALL
mmetsp:Transcript_25131/g.63199  ORF Transcript_25131/g.63199 Transcript_25131/m.63199 type:complete len:201 (-) Transcript_25131:1496-2098(-)